VPAAGRNGALAGARLVAAAHGGAIVVMVIGAPLALRWRWLVPVHLAVAGATIAVNLAGADCPLTTWEKQLLRAAGRVPYERGFNSHYLIEWWRPAGIDAKVNHALIAAWAVPTTVAYVAQWCGRRANGGESE
jgi:hypothetical protein